MKGTMRERRAGYWELRVDLGRDPVTGRRRQKSEVFHGRERDAENELAAFVTRVTRDRRVATEGSLGYVIGRWLDRAQHDLSPTTMRRYRGLYDNQIRDTLGAKPLKDLTAADLNDLYAGLRRSGLGPRSIQQVHAVIRKALNEAIREGWIPANVAQMARPPKVRKPEIHPPAAAEVAKVIKLAVAQPEMVMFLRLAATTGARRGELCALRWQDIQGNEIVLEHAVIGMSRDSGGVHGQRVLVKETKTGQARRISIDPGTVKELRAYRRVLERRAKDAKAGYGDDAFLFSRDPAGTVPWHPDTATHHFRTIADKAGLRDSRLHDIRHYVATFLLAEGTDVGTVADILGHSDAAVTLNVYRHWVPAAGRAASAKLGKALEPKKARSRRTLTPS